MAPRNILLTGAGGFVGRHLVPALRAAFPEARLHTAPFDVTDRTAVESAVRTAQPDACLHLAAIAAIPAARQDPDRAWDVNLRGTLNLARAVLEHAPQCQFLFPASADAYGASFKSGLPLTEEAPLAPLNVYGATKAAASMAVNAMAAEGLRAVSLRPFNHTGPGQTPDFVVPSFARQVARIEAGLQAPVITVGALDSWRDFLDVRDVCAAYVESVRQADRIAPGLVLNVASGVPRRVGDILEQLIRIGGVRAEVETEASRLRPADIPTATGDATRIRALLGWQPQTAWDQTLRDVLDDWRRRVQTQN